MPNIQSFVPHCIGLICVSAALCLASCDSPQERAVPATSVDVVTLTSENVPKIIELPGRIEPVRSAEVRARVDGIVQRRLYQEGSDVPQGARLFQIDPRDKLAQLTQAQATLSRARAAQSNARSIVARYEPLVSRNAVSAQEYDAALSEARQADANVADAGAAVARAKLELSYTTVRAPIAGRVGQAQVTEGALVSAASATLMAQVNQLSPIYATFTEASSQLLDLQQLMQSGAIRVPDLSRIEVRLLLENGQEYGTLGHLDFADQSVNPSTGSQIIRARFPNPDRLLLPGQFVRGRIIVGTMRNGISVPERAVQIDNEEASVLIVGRDSHVQKRTVQLGGQLNGKWTIISGLQVGDKVIVDGWMKVQPGQAVVAHEKAASKRRAAQNTSRQSKPAD